MFIHTLSIHTVRSSSILCHDIHIINHSLSDNKQPYSHVDKLLDTRSGLIGVSLENGKYPTLSLFFEQA
ncbi:TPA: hypothetical protein MH639_26160 [Klebsiella pneumoniae]|nr:hypothetical protein [Klebsiella pneumoniae]